MATAATVRRRYDVTQVRDTILSRLSKARETKDIYIYIYIYTGVVSFWET